MPQTWVREGHRPVRGYFLRGTGVWVTSVVSVVGIATEQVSRKLAELPAEQFVAAVSDALAHTRAAGWLQKVAVLLRVQLSEEARVTELAGEPRRVIDLESVIADIAVWSSARPHGTGRHH